MLIGSLGTLLARAMFPRSIKVSGWQPGPPKSREHEFPKKKNVLFFLKFIGPVAPLWVLQPSQIMHMVATEPLLAIAVFASSIKVFGWQPGPQNSREHDFPKKKRLVLKIIGPVTPLWVLYPSEIMHLGSKDSLLARALF